MTDQLMLNNLPIKYQPKAVFQTIRFWLVVAFLLMGTLSAGKPATGIEPIVLQNKAIDFTPKEFFIANILDERKNRDAVAYLLPAPASPAQAATVTPVDLKGGGLTAIKQFTRQNLKYNPTLRPVIIRIKEYKVTESSGAKGRVNGRVSVIMAFDLQRGDETVQLLEFNGGARYDRPATQLDVVEPALRQSLTEALKYFNTWMNLEANHNEKLAKGLKVTFTDHTKQAKIDTVFYSPDRPLTWNDFRGKPTKPSHYAASVFPSFAYEGQSEVKDGIIHLNLNLKVFMLQQSSWVKEKAKDLYGLNHEQRHFDIVKLVAEKFKHKIKPENLTVEDYNSLIQYQYIESFREMNRLQEQYDHETRHGLDKVAQEHWNKRIEAELQSFKSIN